MAHIEQGKIAQFQRGERLGKNQVFYRCAIGKHYTLHLRSTEAECAEACLIGNIELRAGTRACLHALLVGTVDNLYFLTVLEVKPPRL